jgi:hypothetical protein
MVFFEGSRSSISRKPLEEKKPNCARILLHAAIRLFSLLAYCSGAQVRGWALRPTPCAWEKAPPHACALYYGLLMSDTSHDRNALQPTAAIPV